MYKCLNNCNCDKCKKYLITSIDLKDKSKLLLTLKKKMNFYLTNRWFCGKDILFSSNTFRMNVVYEGLNINTTYLLL